MALRTAEEIANDLQALMDEIEGNRDISVVDCRAYDELQADGAIGVDHFIAIEVGGGNILYVVKLK